MQVLSSLPNMPQVATSETAEAAQKATRKALEEGARAERPADPSVKVEVSVRPDGKPPLSVGAEKLLERLSSEQGQLLLDSGLLHNNKFVEFAGSLDDQQLGKFSHLALALETPPTSTGLAKPAVSASEPVSKLIDNLQGLDKDTQNRLLDTAMELAKGIPMPGSRDTYSIEGLIALRPAKETANDLHNFIAALGQTSEPNKLLDTLEQQPAERTSDLLALMGSDLELTERMLTALEDYDPEVASQYLSSVADIARDKVSAISREKLLEDTRDLLVPADFDDFTPETLREMLNTSVELVENYQFSDDQLQQMSERLAGMERRDQRSYLAMTETGLAQLAGESTNSKFDVSGMESEFELLDSLRNNLVVREAVSESRLGEQIITPSGERLYKAKTAGQSETDQRQLIELLTQAALVEKNSEGTEAEDLEGVAQNLTVKMRVLDADRRDQLVDELHRFTQPSSFSDPVGQRDAEQLQQELAPLSERLTVLNNTDDIKQLLEVSDSLNSEQNQAFWSLAKTSGSQVDELVELVEQTPELLRGAVFQQLIDSATNN